MKKMKKDKKVTVYMENTNYLGEVVYSAEIAVFRSVGWAKHFLRHLMDGIQNDIAPTRYRIEMPDGTAYITRDGENQFVKSLFPEEV